MQDSLQTKAWLIHCLFMTARLLLQSIGIPKWPTESAENDQENEIIGADDF